MKKQNKALTVRNKALKIVICLHNEGTVYIDVINIYYLTIEGLLYKSFAVYFMNFANQRMTIRLK